MSRTITTNVLVVGGGPGGYVAAVRAGQLGLDTVLVEADRLGGTCLIRGCIPSKALIHAADRFAETARFAADNPLGIRIAAPPVIDFAATVRWKDGVVERLERGVGTLLKQAKVEVVRGWATFSDAKTCTVATAEGAVTIEARNVVLATGSEAVALPGLPFGGRVISSTEALSLAAVPRRLAVVGAGYIGLELGTAFRKLGAAVTVVEARERILPQYDTALTEPVRRRLERFGVDLRLGVRVLGLEEAGEETRLVVATEKGEERVACDAVLVTVGRRPRTTGFGLEAMAVDMDGPFVAVDAACRTAMAGVYAIGDLVGEPMLAHKASAQGEMVAEVIAGHRRRFEPAAVPAVCFTDPEIVVVGQTPEEAARAGRAVTVGAMPFSASGRALTLEATDGFVRVVADAGDRRILGIQAVGAAVSELSLAFVAALEMGAVLEDLAGFVAAHPSLGETAREAALGALDRLERAAPAA